jgi:hypothetical protein
MPGRLICVAGLQTCTGMLQLSEHARTLLLIPVQEGFDEYSEGQ